MLGIHSILKRHRLSYNVIDRDKILIPPNWDSWGKIRVLREGFDVEGTSNDWSAAINLDSRAQHDASDRSTELSDENPGTHQTLLNKQNKLLLAYSGVIQDIATHTLQSALFPSLHSLEVDIVPNHDFLATQLAIMDGLKVEEEQARPLNANEKSSEGYSCNTATDFLENTETTGGGRVNEHIGTVHFNMGGIQVDADDVLKRLKQREREETPDREFSSALPVAGSSSGTVPGDKVDSVALTNFFQGLIKKGGGANSPRAKAQQ